MASARRLGRVFVSSVFGGMLELRREAAELIRGLGLEPVLMEDALAHDLAVGARLEAELASCDLYVGVFDKESATVPPGGRSITQEELFQAGRLGLRRLVFYSLVGQGERDADLQAFLDREVGDYRAGVWSRPYADERALRRDLVASLSAARPRLALGLERGPAGLAATLFLSGLGRAWSGSESVGPEPLTASGAERDWLQVLRRLPPPAQGEAGAGFTAAWLPPSLAAALAEALTLAVGRLLVLEVRSADLGALHQPWELLSLPGHELPVRTGALEVVRRLLGVGEPLAPGHDQVPTIPADRLDVLGFTPSPIEDQTAEARMGAWGYSDQHLFWEQEQDRLLAAMEPLLRAGRGGLHLPDEGDSALLAQLLGRRGRPGVLHLACHGGFLAPKPGAAPQAVVFLEDEEGRRHSVAAEELLGWLRADPANPPLGLAVLAASATAAARPQREVSTGSRSLAVAAPSLVQALVQGGVLRALGFLDSVSDPGATAFAGAFYGSLAEGSDLPVALRCGRAAIAVSGGPGEWALPALFTGTDTGPLVVPLEGGGAAPMALKSWRGSFAVGGITYLKEGYVGRRWLERKLARAIREGERLVVLHGLGGIGKSTLASRYLERRLAEGARVLTLYAGRELSAEGLVEEVAERLTVRRDAALPPEEAERDFHTRLAGALGAEASTFLLLDNFEDHQERDGSLSDPALGKALLLLLRLGGEGFRLLLTTRRALQLPPGPVLPFLLDVGELSATGRRKLRTLDPRGLGALDDAAWQKAQEVFGGHPKALQLLGTYLRANKHRARRLLDRLAEAQVHVEKALEADEQGHGRQLLAGELLEEIPIELLPAYDRLCLLTVPVRSEELEALLAGEGCGQPAAALAWLRERGLLGAALVPGLGAKGEQMHRLIASRRGGALAEREGPEAARSWHLRLASHFQQAGRTPSDLGIAAGHLDAAGDRVGATELYQYWAIQLRDRHCCGASRLVAREGLMRFPPSNTESGRAAASNLWLSLGDAAEALGDDEALSQALRVAGELLVTGSGPKIRYARARHALLCGRRQLALGDHDGAAWWFRGAADLSSGLGRVGQRLRAFAVGGLGDLLFARGYFEEALRIRQEEELPVYERLGDMHSRAVTLGQIADVLFARGNLDEALRLRQEEELPVYERLGDVRERAVTLGQIADVLFARGNLDGALRIRQEEELPAYERLGDVRSRAVTLGQIADIYHARGNLDEALRLLKEELLPAFERLGDVRSRAVTLGKIADIYHARGNLDEALRILQEELLPAFERLGDVRSRAVTLGKIADVLFAHGNLDEATRLLDEGLAVRRSFGDVDGVAATQFKLAQVEVHQGSVGAAVPRLVEAWQGVSRIGRLDGIGHVGLLLGRITLASGAPEQARALLEAARDAFSRLGQEELANQAAALLEQIQTAGDSPGAGAGEGG
ncbi:MAG TPA: tetratricopeptide repeat protein [Thermoanaerobaculia bacterium]|nr:tetratricopeptide repeat protein [Thermoanaerobaculia bacterium]